MKLRWGAAATVSALLFAGCTVVHEGAGVSTGAVPTNPWTAQSGRMEPIAPLAGVDASTWQHMTFPGKTATRFSYARKDGRDAIAVLASSSASMLRQKIR